MSLAVNVIKMSDMAVIPQYQTEGSSGMDLHAAIENEWVIPPQSWAAIPCGIKIAIPPGYEGQVRPRSGLAYRHGLTVLNDPGTIDSDFRGEVKVILINHGNVVARIGPRDRIAQLVICPVRRVAMVQVDVLPDTVRGEGGFGSTGIQ